MRFFRYAVILLIAGLTLIGAGTAEATQRKSQSVSYPEIHLKDGLFTTHDGGVICKVSRGWINCSNRGRADITCLDDHCLPHYISSPPPNLNITLEDEQSPKRILPAYTVVLSLPRMGCTAHASFIECRTTDWTGGFQMDRLFARCSNWDDAPSGWPWDGRKHTAKEILPGI